MYEHITVIPSDKTIIINGEALIFDFVADENIHAIQWYDGAGHIEYTSALNEPVTEYANVKPYADLWAAERKRIDDKANIPPTLTETHTVKYSEIISQANAAFAKLNSGYSVLESSTWPVQEAGARAITGTEAEVKDETAAILLLSPDTKQRAVERVNSLAEIDGVTPEEFSQRIITNAEQAYTLGNLTLNEQRGYERQLKDIMDADTPDADKIAAIEGIEVQYTVLETTSPAP